jgi:hypothetical protein
MKYKIEFEIEVDEAIKNCGCCAFREFFDNHFCEFENVKITGDIECSFDKRPDNCPLVEVENIWEG